MASDSAGSASLYQAWGWAQAAQVVESFEDKYVSEPKNVDLKILSLGVKASPKAFASFFESIGSKLRSLVIMNGGTGHTQHSQVIAAIGRCCVHLERFTLKHGMIAIEGFDELDLT